MSAMRDESELLYCSMVLEVWHWAGVSVLYNIEGVND